MRQLNRDEARRIAVRAQMLDAERPRDLQTMVGRLSFLQLDPTAAIAPSADLVSWTRLGNAYSPADLQGALNEEHTLFEHNGQEAEYEPRVAMVRPMADVGLYLGDMYELPTSGTRRSDWLVANARFRQRVLDLLRESGPLASRDIPDTSEISWESTGWTNDRNVTQLLTFLADRGVVAVAGRRGRQRLWDVADRVYPADVEVIPVDEARRIRDGKRLRALGVARPRAVGGAGEPGEIEGTIGEWRVDPEATAEDFEGRTALLSPFDRLVHDRARALELFGFEYTLEMYKPKDKRRWGYFALPVLHHDWLVGKVDAIVDRKAKLLQVHAVHEDVRFTRSMTAEVRGEVKALAEWLGLDGVRYGS